MENNIIRTVRQNEYWASVNNSLVGVIIFGHNGKSTAVDTAYDEDGGSFLHTHFYVELFACIADDAEIMTAGGVIKMERGDVALIPASYPHYAMSSAERLVTLGIYGKRIESKTEYDLYRDIRELTEAKDARLYKSLPELSARIVGVAMRTHEVASPYPAIEMVFVINELSRQRYISTTEATCGKYLGASERDITRFLVIEHIISHYADPYRPDEIAAKLYITRRHLDRIVREHYGKTLREIIYEKRIEHAKRLLSETDSTVEKIALRVGFSGAHSFKNAFLAIVGVPPSEYRISQVKNANK